ncbi:DHA2 family efflux MFS transporter permease subunit [Collinsella sp. An2]|uniref:DHA2 family efflux MFS transporter permease subunit n=1 Tax=Collinsella sp. An2 TaxID=1965585 RepID=UPI0013029900|nr:DHA2 family efflux MFS transporter permease subunit [Collinsella sp. An2]
MSDTMTNEVQSFEPFERRLDAKLIASIVAAGSLSFSAVVFETAMNVALPALMEEFAVDTATIQWITSGYLLMLSVMIPTFSFLKARFRSRRLFIAAVGLFLAGTLFCAAAPAFPVLLLGRVVQGVGTGIAIPLMFSIVVDQVPYEQTGLMMGVASLITSVAPAVGPSYGGVVMEIAGWRMVFVCLVPLLLISFVVGSICVRQATPLSRPRFDVPGFALLALCFFSLILGINMASREGASPTVAGVFAVFVAALVLFALHIRRSDHPLLNPGLFAHPVFVASVVVIAAIAFAILGFAYLVPNYAQLALGASASLSGTLLLPGCGLVAIFAPLGGRVLDRVGAGVPIAIGMGLLLVSTLLFVVFADALTPELMLGFYIFFGVGQGFGMSTTMTHGLQGLPEELRTDGSSVFNTLQQLGGSVGVSAVTAVVGAAQAGASSMHDGTVAGGHAAFMLLAAVIAMAVVANLVAFRARRRAAA